MAKFISKPKFVEYLKKASRRKELYTCTYDNCPLALATGKSVGPYKFGSESYPKHIDGMAWTSFLNQCYEWDKKATDLPQWAIKFVDVFDEVRVYPEQQDAKLALFIMNNLADESDMIERKVYAKFGEKV